VVVFIEGRNDVFEHHVLTEGNLTSKYFGKASSLKQDQKPTN